MKSATRFLAILFVFQFASIGNAQPHQDCIDPLKLCGEAPLIIPFSDGFGIDELNQGGYCLSSEFSSTWLHWTIEGAGYITFSLDAEDGNPDIDIDFIVFKMDDNLNCDTKEAVRCMASGETIGAPSEICVGPTGLAEGEVDFVEEAGCDQGDNNFLAPLEVQQGEQYFIMIMNFSGNESDLIMDVAGTAVIECVTSTTSTIEPAPYPESALLDNIYFSNVQNNLNIQVPPDWSQSELNVYNFSGQRIYAQDELTLGHQSIDFNAFPNGSYIYVLQNGNQMISDQFVKIR